MMSETPRAPCGAREGEQNPLKKFIFLLFVALAFGLVSAPGTWALETFAGTIAQIETQEEDVAITLITEDGNSLILHLDPAEVKDLQLQKGDRIRVSAEGEDIQSVEKL